MLTATARPARGTVPATNGGIAALLDAAPAGPRVPCRMNDPDLWFAEAPADLERAKALCTGCPVLAQCLAGALARHEPWGVWGGEIFEHGSVIAHKRPRGRPRKHGRAAEPTPAGNATPGMLPYTEAHRAETRSTETRRTETARTGTPCATARNAEEAAA